VERENNDEAQMKNEEEIGSQPSWLTRTTAFQAVGAAAQNRRAGSLLAESGWKPDFRRAAFVIRHLSFS
jgi:hypothetical protein